MADYNCENVETLLRVLQQASVLSLTPMLTTKMVPEIASKIIEIVRATKSVAGPVGGEVAGYLGLLLTDWGILDAARQSDALPIHVHIVVIIARNAHRSQAPTAFARFVQSALISARQVAGVPVSLSRSLMAGVQRLLSIFLDVTSNPEGQTDLANFIGNLSIIFGALP